MDLKLDPEAVQSIASAAIFDHLSQDARDSVIKQAIEHLLTPEKDRNRYNVGKTPLQTAFEQAIQQAAYRVVSEKVANDPVIQQHILDLLGPLINSAVTAESEHYNNTLADAVGNALGSWLGDKAREGR